MGNVEGKGHLVDHMRHQLTTLAASVTSLAEEVRVLCGENEHLRTRNAELTKHLKECCSDLKYVTEARDAFREQLRQKDQMLEEFRAMVERKGR